jgi:hypothetical protein
MGWRRATAERGLVRRVVSRLLGLAGCEMAPLRDGDLVQGAEGCLGVTVLHCVNLQVSWRHWRHDGRVQVACTAAARILSPPHRRDDPRRGLRRRVRPRRHRWGGVVGVGPDDGRAPVGRHRGGAVRRVRRAWSLPAPKRGGTSAARRAIGGVPLCHPTGLRTGTVTATRSQQHSVAPNCPGRDPRSRLRRPRHWVTIEGCCDQLASGGRRCPVARDLRRPSWIESGDLDKPSQRGGDHGPRKVWAGARPVWTVRALRRNVVPTVNEMQTHCEQQAHSRHKSRTIDGAVCGIIVHAG